MTLPSAWQDMFVCDKYNIYIYLYNMQEKQRGNEETHSSKFAVFKISLLTKTHQCTKAVLMLFVCRAANNDYFHN